MGRCWYCGKGRAHGRVTRGSKHRWPRGGMSENGVSREARRLFTRASRKTSAIREQTDG